MSTIVVFSLLGASIMRLAGLVPVLTIAMMMLIAPLGIVSVQFLKFATAMSVVVVANTAIVASLMLMLSAILRIGNALGVLMALLIAVAMMFQTVSTACELFGVSLGKLSSIVTSAMSHVAKTIIKEFANIVKIVQQSGLMLLNSFENILKRMNLALHKTNLSLAGMQMMNGLIRGMNAKRNAVISTARSIAQAINKEYAKVQKIHSPSKVWDKFGGFQIQGAIEGIKGKLPQLNATVQKVGNVAMPHTGKYTPESNANSYNTRSSNTEYNTYSPQFNLTVSGTSDDRATARKVKRWIQEAIDDTFESYSNKNPKLREV